MQGTLLGSLYGNLPEPKSGSSGVPLVTQHEQSDVPREPQANETSSDVKDIAKTSSDVSKLASSFVPRNLLLMPPPPRRRDSSQKRDRLSGVLLNVSAKRVKDSVTHSVGDSLNATSATCPTPSTFVLIPENDKSQEAAQSAIKEANIVKNEFLPFGTDTHHGSSRENSLCTLPQKLINEYDPSKPNSYDEFVKERARFHRKKEEERRQNEERERLREEQRLKLESATKNLSLSITGDEAWNRRRQLSSALFGESNNAQETPTPQPVKTSDKGRGFAQKMLEKMGWKHGEGLGKEKQGIVAPLVARKTDKRSGVIIQGNTLLESPPSTRFNQQATSAPQCKTDQVSRIVLLTNLVGNGEVDSELESETTEEASKFGNLLAVRIIELPNVPDDEGVRIFCEYESHDAAVKAVASFHGRLFGGRTVRAHFYPEKLYKENSLHEAMLK